ncbi:hypothetical protein THF5H11_60173 [Vibrio jasicida]|nr:hypothetical protein THF5H11_60173 [Vibrio jasicida]
MIISFKSSASPKITLETDTSEAPEVTPGPFWKYIGFVI